MPYREGVGRHDWCAPPLPFDETLTDALTAFRLHGLASGHSDRTISARDATIRRLGQHVDITACDEAELIEWLAGLDLARSSRATYRAHTAAFFKWMRRTGRRLDNPASDLPSARAPRGVPHPVTPDELAAILDACSHPLARTTRVMVLLAAYAGLRVHEIAKVRGEHLTGGEIRVDGKGGTVSTVPIHPAVEHASRSMPRRGWWFPSSSSRGHVSRVSVSLAIGRAMERAGVNNTPHGLRHHFGTQVLRASGGDLRTTQRALRHANPATTAIYTQVADETLHRAVTSVACPLPCCDDTISGKDTGS